MKLVYLLFGTLCFQLYNVELEAAAIEDSIPFYRYYKHNGFDHFYTTNPKEIGTVVPGTVGKHDYKSEGIACRIFRYQYIDLSPLYRYWKAGNTDHFYTLDKDEIGTTKKGEVGNHGYKSEGIAGYCSRFQLSGTIPLYRYWHEKNGDHFYTTDANEIGTTSPGQTGSHGYKSEGITCYVLPDYQDYISPPI